LSQLLARDYRGVHADVTALIDAGLIERADGKISVPWSRITAEMAVDIAA
jgi:predicted transcriptional regulator